MDTTIHYYLNPQGLTYEDFGGEMVAVNFDTGKYYGLTGSALTIWQALLRPRTVDELVELLELKYSEGEHDIRDMTEKFIKILEGEGLLLQVQSPNLQLNSDEERRPFVAPNLEVHTDLQELIMLDPVHDTDPERGWPVRKAEPRATPGT